ncbi:MAG: ABA4-like family protein [Pseudomonadota bacterium]
MNEQMFSVTGGLAMVGWLALVLLPRVEFVVRVLTRLLIPSLIAVVYLYLMASNLGQAPAEGGFNSLEGVKALFTVDELLLAGWIHYLAFDLFVGSWEVEDAQRHSVPHLLLVPCLFATFMAGPAGLLIYLILRTIVGLVRGRAQEATA